MAETLLITEPGAPDANSWSTLDEFKSYASIRTPHVSWVDTASDTLIEQRMIMATLILNNAFDWNGTATYPDQRLAFPRKGLLNRNGYPLSEDENPIDLKNAENELTLQLGESDLVSDSDVDRFGVTGVKAGDVEVKFQTKDLSSGEAVDTLLARMGSAFHYLSSSIPSMVRVLLVPSWYREARLNPRRRLLFKALGGGYDRTYRYWRY